MHYRTKRLIRRTLNTTAILLFTFAITDALCYRWTLATGVFAGYPSVSPAFDAERMAFLRIDPHGVQEYHSTYYNIDNGVRRTVGSPPNAPHTLWLFGSSPVLDIMVADADTLASQLQRLAGDTYRVVNKGMSGDNLRSSMARLKQTPVVPGDTVVFYHGTGDAFGVFMQPVKRRQAAYPLCDPLMRYWRSVSTAWFLCGFVDWGEPYELRDPDYLTPRLNTAVEDYTLALHEAEAYTVDHGARFVHLLEPALYSREPLAHERPIADSWTLGRPGFGGVLNALWDRLRTIPGAVDLTHALDNARESTLLYVDAVHLNAVGDRLMAAAVWRVITKA